MAFGFTTKSKSLRGLAQANFTLEQRKTAAFEVLNDNYDQSLLKKWKGIKDRSFATAFSKDRKKFINRLKRGAPQLYRWQAWYIVAGEFIDRKKLLTSYKRLAQTNSAYADVINIDLTRTFPDFNFFDQDSRNQLFRILNAYSNLKPKVGYCQGMNFIAGLLLLASGFDESESFIVFYSLMERYKLQGFFLDYFPLLNHYLIAFDRLLLSQLPKLHQHLKQQGVTLGIFIHPWFLTLFISVLPLKSVLIMWDYIFAEGLCGILPLTISILQTVQKYLLTLDFEQILKTLKSQTLMMQLKLNSDNGRKLTKLADSIHVSQSIFQFVNNASIDVLYENAKNKIAMAPHSKDKSHRKDNTNGSACNQSNTSLHLKARSQSPTYSDLSTRLPAVSSFYDIMATIPNESIPFEPPYKYSVTPQLYFNINRDYNKQKSTHFRYVEKRTLMAQKVHETGVPAKSFNFNVKSKNTNVTVPNIFEINDFDQLSFTWSEFSFDCVTDDSSDGTTSDHTCDNIGAF